jgi:quercetin dioxygenase-like cupin family protein
MEIETIKTNLLYTKKNRSSDSKLLAFDLPSLIDSMKQSYTWANGELNALILLKSPEKKIILTAMHEGTEILSFQSNDSVTFQIIEGKLRFHHRKDTFTLNKGQLMTLDENVKYSLTTEEETVFLLTILNTHLRHTSN